MAALKIKSVNLKAYSVLEVVISSTIILIMFIMFSMLVGELTTEHPAAEKAKMLYGLAVQEQITEIDTLLLKSYCTSCTFAFSQSTQDTLVLRHLLIHSATGATVLRHTTIGNTDTVSLFQDEY